MKFGLNELKRPNACVLILLLLMPVLALLTTADNAAAATCACPYGGQYFSSIYTSLCGWQYNVCVTWDYNCANDYPAICNQPREYTLTLYVKDSRARKPLTGASVYMDSMAVGQTDAMGSLTIADVSAASHRLAVSKDGYSESTKTISLRRNMSVTIYLKQMRSANCDPAYPTVCIPPPPPDLDCKDIPYRRFRVLPPDPHHFDGDFDGIGCEWD